MLALSETEMNPNPSSHRKFGFKEIFLIAAFVAIDLTAIWYAANYLKSRNVPKAKQAPRSYEPVTELKNRDPKERDAILSLDKAAWEGSWASLADQQLKTSREFEKSQFKPSLGASVYFFQEYLESGS